VIEAGDRIPAVRASTCDGGVLDLGSLTGKAVLFFYPEASTGG
jgi:peroxiredoxin